MAWNPTRRELVISACATAIGSPGVAQGTYPNRPVKVMVGVPPGGPVDSVLRALTTEVSRAIGQPMPIENKAGGNGVVVYTTLKNSPPDGYTLGTLSLSAFRMPVILSNAGFDPLQDFTYIAGFMDLAFCLAVRADSPFRNFDDLYRFGKASPGKLAYGAPFGLGGSSHLYVEELTARDRLKWLPVPYKGSADCMVGLLAGQVDFSVDTIVSCAQFARDGKIRVLAVCTPERQAKWPDAPTMKELGFDIDIGSAVGIAGPKGLSQATVAKLEQAIHDATRHPTVVSLLAQAGQEPKFLSASQYSAFAVAASKYQRALLTRYGFAARKG